MPMMPMKNTHISESTVASRRRAGRHSQGDDAGDGNAERHVVVDAQHVGPEALVDFGAGAGPTGGLGLVS